MNMEASLFILYERSTRAVYRSFTSYLDAKEELQRMGRGYILIEYGLVSEIEIIHTLA